MTRSKILAPRAAFPETPERLTHHFEVSPNTGDTVWNSAWNSAERVRGLQGKQSAMAERAADTLIAFFEQGRVLTRGA
ncbi:MAG: hypothetical protein LBV61_08520 [Burkholderiaceae bacterium]|jgi:hypothetical protein|nr:hypothetical protein [Burkholderiaceae bacterium]